MILKKQRREYQNKKQIKNKLRTRSKNIAKEAWFNSSLKNCIHLSFTLIIYRIGLQIPYNFISVSIKIYNMKKSFFVGFLATLGVSASTPADWQPTYYKPADSQTSKTETSSVTVTQEFPKVNVNTLFPFSGTSAQSYDNAASKAIGNARSTIVSTDRSIDSLFLRIPSIQEINELILNADTVGILKLIQTVATDPSLTCDQRIAVLQEVFGRINAAVQAKQFAADQLNTIIQGAREEITRLQKQINDKNDAIKNLWLEELRDNLADAISKLETLYRQFNLVESQIAPKEAKVTGLKQEVQIINDVSDAERNRINNDQLKLTEAQANIRELENRLAIVRDQRAALEASIAASQALISSNAGKIKDAKNKIAAIQAEIKKLTGEVDRLRAKYSDIEIEVERLRTEISIAETKADQYRDQIAGLQARIDKERTRIVPDDLDSLNEMIATLKRFIPAVESEIDRHYYFCYGEGSVNPQEAGGVVVYIVEGERFGDYLTNQYGTNIRVPGGSTGNVRLRNVNVFSPSWVDTFGYPFSSTSMGGDSFDIAGSFNCLSPSRSIRGGGTISGIGSDHITVKGYDGANMNFSLGSCTRMESTSELPTVGQNIAYVAVPSSAQGYNLYQASCW